MRIIYQGALKLAEMLLLELNDVEFNESLSSFMNFLRKNSLEIKSVNLSGITLPPHEKNENVEHRKQKSVDQSYPVVCILKNPKSNALLGIYGFAKVLEIGAEEAVAKVAAEEAVRVFESILPTVIDKKQTGKIKEWRNNDFEALRKKGLLLPGEGKIVNLKNPIFKEQKVFKFDSLLFVGDGIKIRWERKPVEHSALCEIKILDDSNSLESLAQDLAGELPDNFHIFYNEERIEAVKV